MAVRLHASLEGAQHGGKSLSELVSFAKKAGCKGVQPSNFHCQNPDGSLMTAQAVRAHFPDEFRLDGISAHCPFWVHTTAWTGSPTIRPFVPADIARKSPEEIEQWAEDYILKLLDLASELEVKVVPMFWGVAFGWELATGYPWGFLSGGSGDLQYDLIAEGKERFVKKTQIIREYAQRFGISLAHEIHPGTAAMCADDFLMLRGICDDDPCLGVNADPSHCWEGESWEDRFTKVGPYVTGCHVKDHIVRPGLPLRCMESNWKKRAMQFTRLGEGQIDLARYSQLMDDVGYISRYCKAHGTETAPAVGEAESAYFDLDETSAAATKFITTDLCRNFATGSFEDGMGE